MGGWLSRKQTFDPSEDLSNLTGRVILITGGNTGIGYETVKHLARLGAKVYLGARNESKATGAIARLKEEGLGPGNGEVVWLNVDYSDPRSAKRAANEFLRREERLDVLINNAAQLTGPFEKTQDGISRLMVVNHFSPFVFTRTLLPILEKTSQEPGSDVRIVTLTSAAHARSRAAAPDINFRSLDDFNNEYADDFYPDFSRYSVTKLANILFIRALQKRLDASNTAVTCLAIHPGEVNTFAARTPFPVTAGILMKLFFTTPEVGAYNSCFAAASPRVGRDPERYKGAYLLPVGVIGEPGQNAKREDLSEELWDTTEAILRDLGI